MDNKNVFAKNLNYYMKEHGKSRREVSEALGVSYYTFTDWVKGKKYPRMDKVERLANYFGILKSDLIEDKTQENPTNTDGVSDKRQALIDFAKSVPEEKADFVLRVMKSILEES